MFIGLSVSPLALSLARSSTPPTPAPIYISVSGNDTTGTGLEEAPYATLGKALSVVTTNGKIRLKSDITLPNPASYTGIIISTPGLTIESDTPGTRRTLDMSLMMSNSTTGGDGIRFSGDSQTIKDLRFTGYSPSFGGTPSDYVAAINPRGTNFTSINCEIDHVSGRGMALGEGGTPTNAHISGGIFHHCSDPNSSSPYGNADGLQIFCGTSHTGIVVEDLELNDNSDDGVDLFFAQAPITFRRCKAGRNGFRADGVTLGGDGTGFKLGGGTYTTAHLVEECLAYDNAGGGFSANDNNGAIVLHRNTSIRNGRAGNVYPASYIFDGVSSAAVLEDNVKYAGYDNYLGAGVTQSYNSWNNPPNIGAETSSWFGINGLNSGNAAFGQPSIGSILLTSGHTGSYIGFTGTATESPPAVNAALILLLLS